MPEVVLWDGKGNAAKVDIPREERMLALLIECWGVIAGLPDDVRPMDPQTALDAIIDLVGEPLLEKRYDGLKIQRAETYDQVMAPIREGLDAAEEAVKER